MSPDQIRVGRVYTSRRGGKTRRKVLEISLTLDPPAYGRPRPYEPIVRYEQDGREFMMYLRAFAAWCGSELSEV